MPVRNYTNFVNQMMGAEARGTSCVAYEAYPVGLKVVVLEQKGKKNRSHGHETSLR